MVKDRVSVWVRVQYYIYCYDVSYGFTHILGASRGGLCVSMAFLYFLYVFQISVFKEDWTKNVETFSAFNRRRATVTPRRRPP